MFDFSTELILNSTAGVSVLNDTQDPSLLAGETALLIKKHNKFRKTYVNKVYKNAGYQPINEVATLDLTGTVMADLTGKTIRLTLDTTLSGSVDGSYSRWAINQGKPSFAEYFVATTPANLAALTVALRDSFNKNLGPNADFVVTSTATSLILTAKNEYSRFNSTALELLTTSSVTGETDITVIKAATITTAGAVGFGTSWFITKNLRLPTIEATRFMGTTMDERPIADSLYNQYTIDMQVLRNITGQGAVGQLITSKTTHVIYVLTSVSAAFEALLTSAFGAGSIVTAKTGVVVNP